MKEQDLCLTYYVNVSIVKQIISLNFVNYFPHEAELLGAQLLGGGGALLWRGSTVVTPQ